MSERLESLMAWASSLGRSEQDAAQIANMIHALGEKYGLAGKIDREPGVEEIVKQLGERLVRAFGGLHGVAGKRILDIACGSNTSKAPPMLHINTPSGERKAEIPGIEGYTALFEPWFCRMLLELGASPVGIDSGDLDGEAFEHHRVDLGVVGTLDFLPDGSFDAVQDSRLFGSPEFKAQFPDPSDRLRIAEEISRQEQRLLKEGGQVIHSDAGWMLRSG